MFGASLCLAKARYDTDGKLCLQGSQFGRDVSSIGQNRDLKTELTRKYKLLPDRCLREVEHRKLNSGASWNQ